MAFRLPNFNLLCNIWRGTSNPHSTTPIISALKCNLQFGKKISFQSGWQAEVSTTSGQYKAYCFLMWLLLPPLTDIRFGSQANPQVQPDWVEVPAGSGRFYGVIAVDDVSKGFTTEYRVAGILPLAPWPNPIP